MSIITFPWIQRHQTDSQDGSLNVFLQCVLCVCVYTHVRVSERTTSYTRYRKNLIQFSSRLSAPRSKLMFAFHAAPGI